MGPERLEEMIKPLETLLIESGFEMDGEPMIDESSRMASFERIDGLRVDYIFEIFENTCSYSRISANNLRIPKSR